MHSIKPQRLRKGDKIGVISPSGQVQTRLELFDKALVFIKEKLGLEVVVSKHALGRHYYSSGTTKERLEDFHTMLKDSSIKAIIFSLGGATAIDLVENLDYKLIQQNPKIISGISDSTTLLNPIYTKAGLISFLGVEFTDIGNEKMDYQIEQIRKTWFEGYFGQIYPNPHWQNFDNLPTSYQGWQLIKNGKATGRIIGGNLNSFLQLYGTVYAPDLEKAILVFETYKWEKREIHQRLVGMKLHSIFKQISGMIVGYCLGSDDPEKIGNERSIKDLLLEVTEGYDFPIMQIGEIGHKVENIMLPIGAKATMDATNLTFSIDEPVVK